MALARRTGFRSFLATAAGNGLEVAVEVGELDWAIETAAELLTMDLERSDRRSILRGLEEARLMRNLPIDDLLADHAGVEAMPAPDPQELANLWAVRALAAFLRGRPAEAIGLWENGGRKSSINWSTSIPLAARAALWADDRATFDRLLDELVARGVHGRAAAARYEALAAARNALDGRHEDAITGFGRAFEAFHELGLQVSLVLACLDMALVLGPQDPAARAALDEANDVIDRYGFEALRARLEALRAGPASVGG